MNVFENKICTFYKTGRSKDGKNVPILDLLTEERYTNSNLINKLRNSGYGSPVYKMEKINLSCATFSSVQRNLTEYHSESNHLMHTGFIQFDIDAAENERLKYPGEKEEMRNEILNAFDFIAYIGSSVSNLGLWGLIPIMYPNRHEQQYRAMLKDFMELGIVLDQKTKNKASYRFISFDPDAEIVLDARRYDKIDVEDISNKQSIIKNDNRPKRVIKNDDIFIAACKWVEAKHEIKFVTGSKHNYLVYLCACLISARVSYEDATRWIYDNLIPENEVTTNCIEHTYKNYK